MPPEKPSSSGPSAPLDCAPLKETYVRCVQAWLRERWQRLDLSPADCGDAFQNYRDCFEEQLAERRRS